MSGAAAEMFIVGMARAVVVNIAAVALLPVPSYPQRQHAPLKGVYYIVGMQPIHGL